MPEPVTLFGHDLPAGFHYRENFITADEEQALLGAVADITFSEFEMRGVVARRRVAFFGESYRWDGGQAASSLLIPVSRQDCTVGWRRRRSICHGSHQRISAGHAYRLAS